MPELPEVETIRRQLATSLPGLAIQQVEQVEPFMLRDVDSEELLSWLPGKLIEGVERQGKFLLVSLSEDLYLTIHLGMTGQLLVLSLEDPLPSHARFVFRLQRGAGDDEQAGKPAGPLGLGQAEGKGRDAFRLVFRDIRKFGRLHLTAGRHPHRLLPLGPDALVGSWTADDLAALLRGRHAPLKAFLLDQRRLSGIGNIYADEILWAARISPLRPAGLLSEEEIERLAAEIRARLAEGVRLRGCSISDFVDAAGRAGSMQEVLNAYGRHGEPCLRCGSVLSRTTVAGRGTAYCPVCQV